jgi:ribosomal protein S18 acetylase RimI-like enzyme
MTDIRYFAPTEAHAAALTEMARQSFTEAFAHLFPLEPFYAFVNQAYGPGGTMERDLTDSEISWLVAGASGTVIGYAKLLPLKAPAPAPNPGALELQQIYVLRRWHGTGIAAKLMDWALDSALARGAPEVYLTVFDHNERAKRFYSRYGFSEVGRCTFTLGDRVYDDRVWCKPLEQGSQRRHLRSNAFC